jgi:hypothetical protein
MRPWIAIALLLVAVPCQAKNHLWKFTEFFSNSDGTIQFIEMQECCGSDVETQMANTRIESNTHVFPFPNHLSGPTAHRWIIIATQGFAALPGAPTPDYIMPDRFFEPSGDTLRYRFGTDIVTLQTGQLPLDGVHSIDRDLGTNQLSVIVNNPINFAGDEGSVTAPPGIPVATPLLWWLGAGGLAAVGVARLRRRARPGVHAPSAAST